MSTEAEPAARLKLANARYFRHSGRAVLAVEVNGRPAYLGTDAKPGTHNLGLVFLGEDFADVCPAVTIRPADGGPLTLVGFSSDPALFALYDAFLRAADDGTFKAGPVATPTA